ncbi:MAG: pyridoxal-phosphate dependent enzyme, partial [Acidimicrobiales bacterium]
MDGSQPDLWRYAAALAPLRPDDRVSVGSPVTPLRRPAPGWPWLKYDHLHPTGSYKDRGAAVLVSHLAAARPGATVFDDSSGNAGAALAAASSTAGLRCRVLVPAANDPGKLALIEAFGAEVE